MRLTAGFLIRWHRRLALIACAVIITWSISGLLHPLMSRYQPQPATRAAPAPALSGESLLTLGATLRQNGIAQVVRARLVAWPAGIFWQVETTPGTAPRYFNAQTGAEFPDADSRYAEYLARHYLAEPSLEIRATRLEQFDAEYVYVNRLLPVGAWSSHGRIICASMWIPPVANWRP